MSQLEQFTSAAIANPQLKSMLKAAATDDDFVRLFVKSACERGYDLNAETVRLQMKSDRLAASRMSENEFEAVAGSMIGARLSGGHTSGRNC